MIDKSTFKNLSATSFFKAGKTSYADSIVVTGSTFINNKASLFNLTEEKENKGYYNVENMKLSGNRIENHIGSLLEIYRGGNDEKRLRMSVATDQAPIYDCRFGVQAPTKL